MKTLKKLTNILFVATLLTMVACDPEEMFSIDPQNPATPGNEVLHTSWIHEKTDTYEDGTGNQQQSTETTIFKFETDTAGTMTYNYVTATHNENYSIPFSYTYSSPNGTITVIEDEDYSETYDFSYNSGNNTLFLYGDDGGYCIIFSRLQK